MAFQQVARLSEIPPGGSLRVLVSGRPIGLYRVGHRIYAMDDVCPHAGTALHGGLLVGTRVTCPGHGWEFDLLTGLAPGEIEETPLARYPVRVAGEEVLIDVEAPLPPGRAEGARVG